MECQMPVNDVQPPLRRRLRQAQRCRDLLVAHASSCHLFNGVQSLCGADHFARKRLGFETKGAVIHGFGVLCVAVRRCAMWKKPAVLSQIVTLGAFFIKRSLTLKMSMTVLGPLLHMMIPRKKKLLFPKIHFHQAASQNAPSPASMPAPSYKVTDSRNNWYNKNNVTRHRTAWTIQRSLW